MDYSENIGLVLLAVIVIGLLVMGGMIYIVFWLFFKKSGYQKPEKASKKANNEAENPKLS